MGNDIRYTFLAGKFFLPKENIEAAKAALRETQLYDDEQSRIECLGKEDVWLGRWEYLTTNGGDITELRWSSPWHDVSASEDVYEGPRAIAPYVMAGSYVVMCHDEEGWGTAVYAFLFDGTGYREETFDPAEWAKSLFAK